MEVGRRDNGPERDRGFGGLPLWRMLTRPSPPHRSPGADLVPTSPCLACEIVLGPECPLANVLGRVDSVVGFASLELGPVELNLCVV